MLLMILCSLKRLLFLWTMRLEAVKGPDGNLIKPNPITEEEHGIFSSVFQLVKLFLEFIKPDYFRRPKSFEFVATARFPDVAMLLQMRLWRRSLLVHRHSLR